MKVAEEKIQEVARYIEEMFYGPYLEALKESVRIPSLSKVFDKEWEVNRYLMKQCEHMAEFVRS
jgi:hypothetical protein